MTSADGPGAGRLVPLVLFEDALWWNVQRFLRLHGYVSTPLRGADGVVYVHKPASPDQPPPTTQGPP